MSVGSSIYALHTRTKSTPRTQYSGAEHEVPYRILVVVSQAVKHIFLTGFAAFLVDSA